MLWMKDGWEFSLNKTFIPALGGAGNIAKEKNGRDRSQEDGLRPAIAKHNMIVAMVNSRQLWLLHWPFCQSATGRKGASRTPPLISATLLATGRFWEKEMQGTNCITTIEPTGLYWLVSNSVSHRRTKFNSGTLSKPPTSEYKTFEREEGSWEELWGNENGDNQKEVGICI